LLAFWFSDGNQSFRISKNVEWCSINGCLNFKIVKDVTKEYSAIRFGVGFFSGFLLPHFQVDLPAKTAAFFGYPTVPRYPNPGF